MFAKRLSKAATSVSAAGDVAGAGVRRHKASQTERDTVRGASREGGRYTRQRIVSMPWHSLCVSLCVSLLICSLCSSAHATATHLSLSYAPPPLLHPLPLHLVHHFPSCFCVHKTCGMTESHSVMQPQHLMPLVPPPTASLWFFGQFKQML